jgi:hypothetical protein
MVLLTLLELGTQGGIFVIKQTYYLGRYMIWGKQKTKEEILEERLEQQMEEKEELLQKEGLLLHELEELKNSFKKNLNDNNIVDNCKVQDNSDPKECTRRHSF